MSSLYEMTQDVLYLQNLLESGDIDEQIYHDTIEAMCIDGKMENICKVMRNLERKSDAYKVEIDRMTARKKTLDNSVNRLKDSMLNYMLVANANKVEAGLFTVSLGKSASVAVTDMSQLPKEFLLPQDPKVDKKGIADALRKGEEVAGAEFVENPYVTIR